MHHYRKLYYMVVLSGLFLLTYWIMNIFFSLMYYHYYL